MPRTVNWCLVPVLVLLGGPGYSQEPGGEPVTRHVPVKPTSRAELDHLEALRLYAQAVIHERNNRLIEAARTYEEALRLDPEAAPVHKALVHLYLALDRADDALACCRRALEIDPGD